MSGSSMDKFGMVLRAYQVYFRKLAFDQIPRIAEKYLGNLGFRIVVDALAEATVAAFPELMGVHEEITETSDYFKALELHQHCHMLSREILGDSSIGLFKPVRVSDTRFELVAENCPFNAEGLQLAAFAGIVVGVLRLLGAKAIACRDEKAARYAKSAEYIVYPEKVGGKECKLVVVKRS